MYTHIYIYIYIYIYRITLHLLSISNFMAHPSVEQLIAIVSTLIYLPVIQLFRVTTQINQLKRMQTILFLLLDLYLI